MTGTLRTSVPYFLARLQRLLGRTPLLFARRRLGLPPRRLWRRVFFAHRLPARKPHALAPHSSTRRVLVHLPPEVRLRALVREVDRVRYVTRRSHALTAAPRSLPRALSTSSSTTTLARRTTFPPAATVTQRSPLLPRQTILHRRVFADPFAEAAPLVLRPAPARTPPTLWTQRVAFPTPPATSGPQRPDARASASAPVRVEPSSGAPLQPALRRAIRRRVGFDPVRVRIHAGEAAHRAASTLRAAAFTLGENIYFARGRFDPSTPAGRELLVHELVHVRQQPEGRAFRPDEVPPIRLAALEAEARGAAPPPRPRLVLAPPSAGGGPAPAVPLLAEETSAAVASPTPTTEPTPPPAAAPAAPAPPDARQVAEEVVRLIERRHRIERERTGVQQWR